jgi:flagellar hook-basal body complex protein FliE
MLSIKPELQRVNPLPLMRVDARHLDAQGVVGFKGSYDHGGILSDITPTNKGKEIVSLGTKIGADAVLRAGALGAAGINRVDGSNFANAMLNAIDGVSEMQNRASELTQEAIINPDAVDAHDLSIAQTEARLSISMARTILSRLTQAWRDLVNTR